MPRRTDNQTPPKTPLFGCEGERSIILPEVGIIQVFGEISLENTAPAIAYIHYLNAVTKRAAGRTIRVFVNSDGGNYEDGFALADTIRTSAIKVATFCLGRAYSIALPIFMAGDARFVYRNASAMFHGVSLDAGGTAKSLRSTVDGADKANDMMMGFIASRSKIPLSMLKAAVEKNKDLYLYPEDLIKYKMAHEIL